MQHSSATPKTPRYREGFVEDCCMLSILLAVPSCFNSFWHSVIPTSYCDFYTCFFSHMYGQDSRLASSVVRDRSSVRAPRSLARSRDVDVLSNGDEDIRKRRY